MADPQERLSFGHWLKQHRKALDLTQEGLAERIGCSYVSIHKIEAGTRRPSRQLAELLADIFKVPTDEREAFVEFARGLGGAGDRVHLNFSKAAFGKSSEPSPDTASNSNLPAQLTRLIGRDEIVAEISSRLLHDEMRLLTLTGPPGIGKTRVALQAASDVLGQYEQGVFFVPLAPISDHGLVVPMIAQTLGVRESQGESITESLLKVLHDKQMLLVLDNFEQVVEAAPAVKSILEACPRVKMIVTSREPLHVRGERVFGVPPLELPDLTRTHTIEDLFSTPAVTFFIERARAAEIDFVPTAQNAQALAAICIQLEGLPLAIELAAARIRMLTPQEIQERLDSRLKLLSGGLRDLPARQQTLRSAIDWSYALLSEGEQKLFARLGVFSGGCTLLAAEAICNALDDLPFSILDGLLSLLDKSLLKREKVRGESRYTMLETIREYAGEKLKESGEAKELRRWQAEYFLVLAEETESKLRGPDQAAWFDRLEDEQDNMRAVLEWCQRDESGAEGAKIGLRLVGALAWYWYTRGPYSEGRQRVADALSQIERVQTREPAERSALRVKALRAAAMLAWVQGDFASSRSLYEEILVLARERDDRDLEARTLNNMGIMARDAEGDYARARSLQEQGLAIIRELGDMHSAIVILNNLGGIDQIEGDFAQAHARHEEALAIAREVGDKTGIAHSLQWLGDLAYFEENYPLARKFREQALAEQTELGDKWSIPSSLRMLGCIALRLGEHDRAAALLRESLTFCLEQGIRVFIFLTTSALAGVAGARGGAERAARLFGASEAMWQAAGGKLYGNYLAEMERDVAAARAQLDEVTWQKAWQEGQSMSMDVAIAYALEE